MREPSERLTDGLCVDCVGFRAARLEAEEALENLKGKLSPCKVCGVNELSETLSDGVCLECRRDKKLSSANLNVSNIQYEPFIGQNCGTC